MRPKRRKGNKELIVLLNRDADEGGERSSKIEKRAERYDLLKANVDILC